MAGLKPPAPKDERQAAADAVSMALDADVILINGRIERHLDRHLIELCLQRRRKSSVFLILVTQGGDADAAYRIARCLQESYQRFVCFISGYCKSAGTLIALGAHELTFCDHGELGPLDVQMAKKDDLWELESGLTVMTALGALHEKAFSSFEYFFMQSEINSNGRIPTQTAV
jgi:ClpP class serine protease